MQGCHKTEVLDRTIGFGGFLGHAIGLWGEATVEEAASGASLGWIDSSQRIRAKWTNAAISA